MSRDHSSDVQAAPRWPPRSAAGLAARPADHSLSSQCSRRRYAPWRRAAPPRAGHARRHMQTRAWSGASGRPSAAPWRPPRTGPACGARAPVLSTNGGRSSVQARRRGTGVRVRVGGAGWRQAPRRLTPLPRRPSARGAALPARPFERRRTPSWEGRATDAALARPAPPRLPHGQDPPTRPPEAAAVSPRHAGRSAPPGRREARRGAGGQVGALASERVHVLHGGGMQRSPLRLGRWGAGGADAAPVSAKATAGWVACRPCSGRLLGFLLRTFLM